MPNPRALPAAAVLRAASRLSVIATDLHGVISVFNTGAEELLGYRAEELVGRSTPKIFHVSAELDAYGRELSGRLGRPVAGFETFVALAQEGGPKGYDRREWTYVRKDGSHVPVELTVTGVYGDSGALEGYLGVAQDLSSRKALESELRQAQLSVDNAGDIILWGDIETGRIVFANKAACTELGYTREELLALTIPDISPTRNLEAWRAHGQALRDVGPTTGERPLRRKDGSQFYVESSSTLVEHEGGVYSLGIMRDVTRRRLLQAQLRQARVGMDSVQDMIFWVRVEDRRVTYANRAAYQLLGYGQGELIGLDAVQVNPERGGENWRESCARLRQGGRHTFEALYRRKDGSLFPVETSATIVIHEGQEYAVGIVRDITDRKAAEERLRQETRLNASVAEAARALLGPSPDMTAIAELLLARACELTGSRHGYVAFVDEDTGGLQPRAMSAMIQNGECKLGELPVTFPMRTDGGYNGLWGYSLNTRQGFYTNDPAAHPAATGLPSGHVSVRRLLSVPALSKNRLVGQITLANASRDYTGADLEVAGSLADLFALGAEQQLSQRELVAAKEEAESSSRVKSQFLANMTHEVRTPLNGVLGMLQVLQATPLAQDQKEYAAVALEAAERLNQLFGNVLEFARLDSASAEAECLLFPPTDLVSALRAVYQPQAEAKGLAFLLDVAPGLPELIRSDPQALRQALAKLLDNALKFTPSGQVTLAVALEPEDATRITFRVEDSGIGIPAEQREQVFEAFRQADASFTRTYGGAGLGLAIVRRLARQMGGVIQTADRPGGGTVMRLTIPVDCDPQSAA